MFIIHGDRHTHPLRHRLLELVIEETFVNSSLSGQRLRRRLDGKKCTNPI